MASENATAAMPAFKLKSGALMPAVGLGTWKSQPGEVEAAVLAALKSGYRHIDCAACYGNEKEVGSALRDAFKEGVCSRKELFVTGKLWNSEHAPKNVQPALEQTLKDLGLEYVDLYLIHWPQAFQKVEGTNRGFPKREDGTMIYDTTTSLLDTWGAMEKLVDQGLTKHIGLSNFNSKQIKEIVDAARVQPMVLQVESHPHFSQKPLLAFTKERGIVITAYSPLGSGSECDGYIVPLNPKLQAIGKKYGKSAAQVALAWQVCRGVVVIPKSVKAHRIKENFDVTFKLSDEDMAAVDALNRDVRVGWGGPRVKGEDGALHPRDEVHPNYPFKAGIDF